MNFICASIFFSVSVEIPSTHLHNSSVHGKVKRYRYSIYCTCRINLCRLHSIFQGGISRGSFTSEAKGSFIVEIDHVRRSLYYVQYMQLVTRLKVGFEFDAHLSVNQQQNPFFSHKTHSYLMHIFFHMNLLISLNWLKSTQIYLINIH